MPDAHTGFGEQIRLLKEAIATDAQNHLKAANDRHQETLSEIRIVREALQGPVGKLGLVAKVDGHHNTLRWHNVVMVFFLASIATEVVRIAVEHAMK